MDIKITGRNFNPSERLQAEIEKKMSKLDKYFSGELEAAVVCREVRSGLCKLEATIYAGSLMFRAEESGNDIHFCLDRVIDKLSSQMSRLKTRLIRRHKEQKELLLEEIPDAAEEAAGVVRTKRFKLHPMNEEEAMQQMELLDHTFFVYKDAESGGVNVLYKREDGSYGLLVTEN
jgi:putative sigma-54 modulation protein